MPPPATPPPAPAGAPLRLPGESNTDRFAANGPARILAGGGGVAAIPAGGGGVAAIPLGGGCVCAAAERAEKAAVAASAAAVAFAAAAVALSAAAVTSAAAAPMLFWASAAAARMLFWASRMLIWASVMSLERRGSKEEKGAREEDTCREGRGGGGEGVWVAEGKPMHLYERNLVSSYQLTPTTPLPHPRDTTHPISHPLHHRFRTSDAAPDERRMHILKHNLGRPLIPRPPLHPHPELRLQLTLAKPLRHRPSPHDKGRMN
jgi:hypothetical protein